MDRTNPSSIRSDVLLAGVIAFFVVSFLPAVAVSGVVLNTPRVHGSGEDEEFGESRFGAPPTSPLAPARIHAANEEASEGRNSRAPASVVDPATGGARTEDEGAGREGAGFIGKVGALFGLGGSDDRSGNDLVPNRQKGVQEVALIASDSGYLPKTIFVTKDVPVRVFVTSASKETLCFMLDAFSIRKQVRNPKVEELNFTPTQPGPYRFYCPVNKLEGTLVVRDVARPQE